MNTVQEARYIDLVREISCQDKAIQSFSDKIARLKDSLGIKGFLNCFEKILVIGKIISNWFAIIGAKIQLSISNDKKTAIENTENLEAATITKYKDDNTGTSLDKASHRKLEDLVKAGKRAYNSQKASSTRKFIGGSGYDQDDPAIILGSKAALELKGRESSG